MISYCLKNRRGRLSVTSAPDVPPHTTSRPPAFNDRSERSQVAAPTLSTTTSACTSQRSAAESTTATAPIALACSRLSALRLVATTWAPRCRAMARAAQDTPEPTPTTSTVWPAATRARRSIRYAVSVASGYAAHSSHERPAGRCTTFRDGATAHWACPPHVCSP